MEQGTQLAHLTNEEQQILTEFVEKIHERLDGRIMSVTLFGSKARGEAKPDSDIDVLVVLDNEDPQVRKEIRYLATEVWLDQGIYLSTRVWSLGHWRELQRMQTLLYRNICRDGIDLLSLCQS